MDLQGLSSRLLQAEMVEWAIESSAVCARPGRKFCFISLSFPLYLDESNFAKEKITSLVPCQMKVKSTDLCYNMVTRVSFDGCTYSSKSLGAPPTFTNPAQLFLNHQFLRVHFKCSYYKLICKVIISWLAWASHFAVCRYTNTIYFQVSSYIP